MSGRPTGARTIDIDGQAYTFLLDLQAMVDIEELYSTPETTVTFDQVIKRAQETHQAKILRDVAWAMLQHHHPELTREQVGRIFTLRNMQEMTAAMSGMVESATPDPDDAMELGLNRPPKARANGRDGHTGESSRSRRASLV